MDTKTDTKTLIKGVQASVARRASSRDSARCAGEANHSHLEPDSVTGGNCFAGHTDWRLPRVDELRTIRNCSFGIPCIDPVFGPTASSFYWSAASLAGSPSFAWNVNLSFGFVFNSFKTISPRWSQCAAAHDRSFDHLSSCSFDFWSP